MITGEIAASEVFLVNQTGDKPNPNLAQNPTAKVKRKV
jgi:hypothetical protein